MRDSSTIRAQRLKILVTDGSYKNSLAVVRALGEQGHNVYVVGGPYCLANLSQFSRPGGFVSSVFGYFGSSISDEMLQDFLDHINLQDYDLIVPVGGKSVELLSISRSMLGRAKVILPDHDAILLALDKRRTSTLANSLNIKTPREYKFSSIQDVDGSVEAIDFPVVLKSSNELHKYPAEYFYNKESLLRHLKHFEAHRLRNKWSFPIIQQYIEGKGVGYFGVFSNGSVVSSFMHERVRETPPSGGASSCAKSIYMSELEDQGKRLLEHLVWSGPAMVEFKISQSDGHLYLMEINPKLWGSLDLAISCGVNIPVDIVSLIIEPNQPFKEKPYIIGKLFSWPFDGEIRHVLENPKAFVTVLLDSCRPSIANNLRLTDLKPGLLSLVFSCRNIVMHLLRKTELLRFISLSRKIGLRFAIVRLWTESTGVPIRAYSKIDDFLYVGQQHSKKGIKRLKQWKIELVISLRAEYDDKNNSLCFCEYSYLPVVEFQSIPFEILEKGVALIKDAISKKKSVYVHCAEGVSRAPTLAAAYLISEGMSVDEAIFTIKKNRPFINILDGQLDALKDFESRSISTRIIGPC